MLTVSKRHQLLIGIVLAALMIATRSQHFPTLTQTLPSASWAVFFLAGVYLRPLWVPLALFGLSSLLDFSAINWQGVSDYCVSPAYIALIPAYGALWAAGRWYASRYSFKASTLAPLAGAAVLATVVCEFFSSASFYFYSGRFASPTWGEFMVREAVYFPGMLWSLLFWVGVAALLHVAILTWRSSTDRMTPA